MFDFLIVGAGLSGAAFARVLTDSGAKCLVTDRRSHVAGNVYSEEICGIETHRYGAHIFHTDSDEVWRFMNRFAEFTGYVHSPIANYKGKLYHLPFNMNTFYELWGTVTPDEAREKIAEQTSGSEAGDPKNLEEQALRVVGSDIYETLIKGYTEKQWGRPCRELPASIIRRLPLRFTYDNNYFSHRHQGMPAGGYTAAVKNMLEGIELRLGEDFLKNSREYRSLAKNIFYTGPIDELCGYEYGALEYRSLRFETKALDTENHQGVSVMNYTDLETPFTRVIEHRHFHTGKGDPKRSVVTWEYPAAWTRGSEPYYPVNDEKNEALYKKYLERVKLDPKIIIGGRLGKYRYFDMDQAVADSLAIAKRTAAH